MFFKFLFHLNIYIFMCNVLNIINLHKNVNINMFFNSIIKKTLQIILYVLKIKERL